MTNIEENAYKRMISIFETLVHDEKHRYDGYFAGDMIKVNNKSSISPVFVGFNRIGITIVCLSRELEKEHTMHMPLSQLKEITLKKKFLSKIYTLRIQCTDSTAYIVGVPHALSYIPVQRENVDLFLTCDFFMKISR